MELICSCQDPSTTYTEYGGGFTKTEISNISGLICIRVSTFFVIKGEIFSKNSSNHNFAFFGKLF